MSAAIARIARIASRALALLAGNGRARRRLGYAAGIALFLALLPLLAVWGLFGWTAAGGAGGTAAAEGFLRAMPAERREQLRREDEALGRIGRILAERGAAPGDVRLAQTIYVRFLSGMGDGEDFCRAYADCFPDAAGPAARGGTDPLANVSSAFGVAFTEADREILRRIREGDGASGDPDAPGTDGPRGAAGGGPAG